MTPISATLTPEQRDAVMQAVATIKTNLPFLVDLSSEERKTLPKMGDKSQAFVSTALEVATQNAEWSPERSGGTKRSICPDSKLVPRNSASFTLCSE